MKIARKAPRGITLLLLSAFAAASLATASGCWFSPGKEGFVCKTNQDCKEGLRCRTYQSRGKTRKQCRPYNKRTISSKSGYTTFAIYLSYGFWGLAPFGLIGLVVWVRREKQKTAEHKDDGEQSAAS